MANNEVLIISVQKWGGDTSEMVIFNQNVMYTNEQGHFKLNKRHL